MTQARPDGATASIEAEYVARLAARRAVLADRERLHAWLSYTRLALIAAAIAIVAWLGWQRAAVLVIPGLLFAAVAIVHARAIEARDRAQYAVSYYERGLARLHYEWIGHGEAGDRYRPDGHPYADDLDLFGRGSLFELVCTARTRAGEETLATWLLGAAAPEVVLARQEAVRELVPRLDLREALAVAGDGVPHGSIDAPGLRAWASQSPLARSSWPRVGMAVGSTVFVILVAWLAGTGALPRSMARLGLAILMLQAVVVAILHRRVAAALHAVETPARDLDLFATLLRVLERETFTSPRLQAIAATLRHADVPASREIARLERLVALLESRSNLFIALPAALVFWGTQMALAIDAWRRRCSADIPHWLTVVGEFDALVALATYAVEHPGHAFPIFTAGPPQVTATALAHPLLPASAVANDLAVGGAAPHLFVVSGSNMSGKSTLLRALGLNAVLAQAGAPVRAASFTLSPLAVGASIRIVDSVTDGRSRFYAEILRLKQIVDLTGAERGRVLFLLDEILSGTNSHDRRHGAEALLAGLVARGAVGLVTTHDLALGEIAAHLGAQAANVHFEDRFVAGTMTFDYRLRPGVVQTSNAVELMRSIGLEV